MPVRPLFATPERGTSARGTPMSWGMRFMQAQMAVSGGGDFRRESSECEPFSHTIILPVALVPCGVEHEF